MVSPMMNVGADHPKFKVSISARLIAAVAYIIPALGGVVSSYYLLKVLGAMRAVENAGITVILASLAESTIPVLVSFYLGIVFGFIVIIALIARMIMQTKTASPPGWYFLVCAFFSLVPAGLFLEAESLIIEFLTVPDRSAGIAGVASTINLLLISSIFSAMFVFMALLLISVLPFSKLSKPKWSPLIAAVLVEILLIAAVIVFQWRYLWLSQAGMYE